MQRRNQLTELDLFSSVCADTISDLWKKGRIESFPKGCVIMRAKEPLKSVYIQLTRKSIVYNLTHTGKRKIIFIFGSGTLLNEHVLDSHNASLFCEIFNKAIDNLDSERGRMGAYKNRLEHIYSSQAVSYENLSQAESRIRDTNMAEEVVDYTKNNIILQASQSMLAHANMLPQNVTRLLPT